MPHSQTTDDNDLLRAWVEHRDEASLEELFDRYRPALRATTHRILHDAAAEDDAIQETFIKLSERGETISGPVEPWLRHVAAHVAISHLRSHARRNLREAQVGIEAATTPEPSSSDAYLQELASACVATLAPAERELIIRLFYKGHARSDLAREYGISHVAIHKRLQSSLQHLRALFARRGVRIAGPTLLLLLADGDAVLAARYGRASGGWRIQALVAASCVATSVLAGWLAWTAVSQPRELPPDTESPPLPSSPSTPKAAVNPTDGMADPQVRIWGPDTIIGGGVPGRWPSPGIPAGEIEICAVRNTGPSPLGLLEKPVDMEGSPDTADERLASFSGLVQWLPFCDSPFATPHPMSWPDGSRTVAVQLHPPKEHTLKIRFKSANTDKQATAAEELTLVKTSEPINGVFTRTQFRRAPVSQKGIGWAFENINEAHPGTKSVERVWCPGLAIQDTWVMHLVSNSVLLGISRRALDATEAAELLASSDKEDAATVVH